MCREAASDLCAIMRKVNAGVEGCAREKLEKLLFQEEGSIQDFFQGLGNKTKELILQEQIPTTGHPREWKTINENF